MINIIDTLFFFSSRKAVAKTSVLHNLAVYVAQDCTGEIYRLLNLIITPCESPVQRYQ